MSVDNIKMAQLILPDVKITAQEILEKYPPRQLKEGAMVTRFAPSPTGFLHIGGLFTAMVNKRAAMQSDGVFYIRIEDTDKKREIEDGVKIVIDGLNAFGIDADEGFCPDGQKGDYGPYQQSQRRDIYRAFVKQLMEKGMAYPCFLTEQELSEIRAEQEKLKVNTGIYGKWAKYRDITVDEAQKLINEGKSFVVRLRSPGDSQKRISFKDAIKGKIEMSENDQDVVILKADGIPTYHFAHAIDDHLMGTTHVIRGDEWISSAPIHLQLFYVLGFKPPVYAHVSPIMKEENGGKRKLSKRKDPEAAVGYYYEQGYPKESVMEYLMTIANSNYEDWRKANQKEDNKNFPFNLKKLSLSGALFDLVKLNDVSKNIISIMPAQKVFELSLEWAKQYDKQLAELFERDRQYATEILNIDRENKKPRKDIAKWSDVRDYVEYMYDEIWDKSEMVLPENISNEDGIEIIDAYLQKYNPEHTKDEWFNTMKEICEPLGFASEVKVYKKNPDAYKGHVGDISTVIRIALTGRKNTPDLYYIMKLLGQDKVKERLNSFKEKLS